MQQTIVVPLDGSPLAEHALPYATSLARRLDARVAVLHAHISALLPDDAVPDLEAVAARLRGDGVTVDVHVCHLSSPEETGRTLLDAAATLRGSMMVLATHGRGGLGRMIYGSVADQVLRQADLPVLLVSPDCDRLIPADGPLRILVPLDGSAFAEEILPPLQHFARTTNVELLMLRVAETIEPRHHGDECVRCRVARERNEEPDLEYVRARQYISVMAEKLRRAGMIAASKMVVGHAPSEIGRVARERKVDLIAMATHGRGGLARLVLGSVASATLRQAAVPVLLVRPAAVRQLAPGPTEAVLTPSLRVSLKVKDIMSQPAVTVGPGATLEEIARLMIDRGIGGIPVVDNAGHVVGIVTESDFCGKECYAPFSTFKLPQVFGEWMPKEGIEAIYRAARTMTAQDVMSAPVATAIEDEPISVLIRRMVERDIKRLPVVRGTIPVGMVTRHDLLRMMTAGSDDA